MRSHRASIGFMQVLLGILLFPSLVQAETIPSTSEQVAIKATQTYFRETVHVSTWNYDSGKLATALAVANSFCAYAVTAYDYAYNPSLGGGGYCAVLSADETTGVIVVGRSCDYGCTANFDAGPFIGCPDETSWNGTACVATTYSCPTTGTWVLSADQQTCSRCPTPLILNADNACIGPDDKGAGPNCQEEESSNPPPPWSTSP